MKQKSIIPLHKRIGAIFAFLDENFEFTTEKSKIHNAFYNLSSEADFKEIFSDVDFSTGGDYYKSEEIERIMDNLVFSRLLSAKNPDLIRYETSKGLREIYSTEIREHFPEIRDQIIGASAKFKELITE